MDPSCCLYITLIVIFIFFSACFSCLETAFSCLNKYKYKVEAENGSKKAKLICSFHDKFDSTLITILIGNNVMAILLSVVSTFLFIQILPERFDETWAGIIASIIIAILTFFFGDVIPKLIGKKFPDWAVSIFIYPIAVIYVIIYPISIIFYGLSCLAKKIFRSKPEPEMTEEEFSDVVSSVEEAGELEANESDIIQASIDFADTKVKEVFTPRSKMWVLDIHGKNNQDIVEFIKNCPYSRIPCYNGNIDYMVGVLVVKKYLNAYFQNPKVNYLSLLEKPYFISSSVNLDDLVEGFARNHTHIALVRDKNKNIMGMITMEDVLEELVGEIEEKEEAKGVAR